MTETPALTPRQTRALAALLREDSVAAAARVAQVNPRTLFRWLEQRPFRQALNKVRREALSLATRVRAVVAAARLAQQGVEIDEFEDRITELEEAKEAMQNR